MRFNVCRLNHLLTVHFETSHLPPLLLDRVSCQAKRCKLRKSVTGWVIRVLKAPWDANEAEMSLSPVHLLRERGSYQASMYMYKNLAPMPGNPLVKETNGKNNGVQKRRHCGPCALEVTNLNSMASNMPRTCSKSQSLPNSVIFITELHLHVFLALCSSSNSGKSLWTWPKTSEARSTRSSLDHKTYIPNCRD